MFGADEIGYISTKESSPNSDANNLLIEKPTLNIKIDTDDNKATVTTNHIWYGIL